VFYDSDRGGDHMTKFTDDESFWEFTKHNVFAPIAVGTFGGVAILIAFAILQLLVQGEVTVFTERFWDKASVS
jgi:hypothetical protein